MLILKNLQYKNDQIFYNNRSLRKTLVVYSGKLADLLAIKAGMGQSY